MTAVDRAAAIAVLQRRLTDELVVAALGNPAYDLFNAGDRPEHFYMWGAMGLGHSVGLGVAVASPQAKVIALEGDGGVLMNLGALATIGSLQPQNLVLIIWDNGMFDLTGGQRTAAAGTTDLAAIAGACGIAQSRRITSMEEFEAAIQEVLERSGPWCLVVDTGPTPQNRVKPLVALRTRFMQLEPFIAAATAAPARQGETAA